MLKLVLALVAAHVMATAALGITLAPLMLAVATPCPTEDSTNCRWDAGTQGNGEGLSFVDANGMIIFY